MMKSILTTAMVLVTIGLMQAQWTIGPRIALGVVTPKSEQIPIMPLSDFLTYDLNYMGSSSVRSIGIMAFDDVGPGFVQFEALATWYELEYSIVNFKQQNSPQYYREGYFKIEMPVAAGVKVEKFKVGLGPVFEYNVERTSQLQSMENYRDTGKKVDFGFQGLIGYRVGKKIHIDLRYVNKFSTLVEDFALGYDEFRYKKSANRITISVGMGF